MRSKKVKVMVAFGTRPEAIKLAPVILELGKYPHIFKGGATGFEPYLHSELETYSDKTLQLYFEDVSQAEKEGANLAEERYTRLFQQIGHSSIAEADEEARANDTTSDPPQP